MDTPSAPPLSNDASSVAQQEPPAALPEVYHEGIPESVESERLSELKKVASERASREGPCVTKGSPAALAQSAADKYAAAIGQETGLDTAIVQQVEMTDKPVDEARLVNELRNEAERRTLFEITTQGNIIPGGPAVKVEEAAERLERSHVGNTNNQTSAAPLDEGIPTPVESERLSELKKAVRDHSLKEGPQVSKGSATSFAQSAMGNYATVVGRETGLDPSTIQRVKMKEKPVDKARLVKELKAEAQQRVLSEVATQGKIIPGGPAEKVEEAAEKLETAQIIDALTKK